MSGAERLRVGAWCVEPDLNRIVSSAGAVPLMPKAMAVLVYMAERPGQVVSADELIAAVWLGRPMGDNPVYKCITQLRRVLGDDPKAPSYIATVQTKGYRLIAPVERHSADASPASGETETLKSRDRRRSVAWSAGILAAGLLAALFFSGRDNSDPPGAELAVHTIAESPSVAVLPFANMSPDPGQDYFADGLSEELIAQLASLPGLRVIGRTSSFAFKGKNEDLRTIGRTLGVNHVLEGSIRKTEDRVRITAQLINPADGSHLWSQVYDRNLDDIFTIQEEIAKTVASALRISIAARSIRQGGTRDFEAYDAYLAGLAAVVAGGAVNVLASIAALERAVAIDPGFIAAYEVLAGAYRQASIDIPERRAEWLEQLAGVENRLLELAPDWPAANFIAAQREVSKGNLIEAERLFGSVRELPPGHGARYSPYGVFLLNVGRPRDAINFFLHDRQAEPLVVGPSLWLQIAYELVGDYAQANAEYQRALGFADDTRAIRTMALVRAMGRRDKEAIRRELPAQIAVGPVTRRLNDAMLRYLDDPPSALVELQRHLEDPESVNSTIVVMMISAWAAYFGDPELAVRAMGKLPPLAHNAFNWIIWRPVKRDMRRLPEFKELVRAWGLVDYWRTTGKWGDYCRPRGTADFDCGQSVVAR